MRFENAKEALEWFLWIKDMGAKASGSFFKTEEDLDSTEIDKGTKINNIIEDVMITKLDIEKTLDQCFQHPANELLSHWAIDGYSETIVKWFPALSPIHKNIETRKDKLESWIQRFELALFNKKYLRTWQYQNKTNVNFSS